MKQKQFQVLFSMLMHAVNYVVFIPQDSAIMTQISLSDIHQFIKANNVDAHLMTTELSQQQ
jgi:hypothetical protein